MNPIELKYYSFMIKWTKCTGSCNDLSPKLCVPKETKDINVKGFAMITKKMKVKQGQSIFQVIVSTTCNSEQNRNNKTCKSEWKNYHKCEKDYSCNPTSCIC